MQTWNHNSNYMSDGRKHSIMQLLQRQAPDIQDNMLSARLERAELLPFLRKVESIVADRDLVQPQSAIVYWSSTDATWLLPERAEFQALTQATLACASFSEHRQVQNSQDEFCFALLSKELSVIVYGFAIQENPGVKNFAYQCTLSFEPSLIKRVFRAMAPYWEFIDPTEADKLDSVTRAVEATKTSQRYVNSLGQFWTELKISAQGAGQSQTSAAHGGRKQARKQETVQTAAETEAGIYELMQRIATDYPYPIANPYRVMESLTDPAEKYKEQLRLVENLLAFLAGLSLSITVQSDPSIMQVLRTSLSTGISVGHWRELIRKCSLSWKNNSTKNIPLAQAILNLQVEQVERGFGKSIEQLVRARNDFAHHRGPTAESQIEKESIRIGNLLKSAIEESDFLCNFPIKIVKAIDVLPSGLIKMICLKASGDHPALRQEELNLNRGFPKGQLIINAGDNNWLSLFPFLNQDICPKCGMMEIYLLDKWKFDRNQLFMRSFERGHTMESSAISNALKQHCH